MKKIITLIAICFSLTAFAQKEKPKTDSTGKQVQQPVQQPNKDQVYFILGKIESFSLLYQAVASPDDVTTNQKKALLDWLNKNVQPLPADSTKKK